MSIETLSAAVRNIPDFPIPGIQFKDITPIFQSPTHLKDLSEILFERYRNRGITKVVGIESRGFFMGPALAIQLGAGFIPVRKPGKLPFDIIEETYTKVGEDTIQIHADALDKNDVVLIHDDFWGLQGELCLLHIILSVNLVFAHLYQFFNRIRRSGS